MKLLFIGDSVTDGGRTEGCGELGNGFVSKIAGYLALFFSSEEYEIVNRGINGHEAINLAQRWESDCLSQKPDVVTLMVGINDVGRRYDENRPTTVEDYEATLDGLLQALKSQFPSTDILLMEPYLIDTLASQRVWREDLDPKRIAIQRLARKYRCRFLPLDGIFGKLSTQKPPEYWSLDGVHPTSAGSTAIALEWLRECGLLTPEHAWYAGASNEKICINGEPSVRTIADKNTCEEVVL